MLVKESIITALSSIRSNVVRSILTALAIIIGTAAVIAVIGLGSSASKALDESIEDLGGRTLYVSPGQNRRGAVTKGFIPLQIKDAEALAANDVHKWKISPTIARNRQIKYMNANINERVGAYLPIHFNVRGYELDTGRIFNEKDNLGRKRVVVIGSDVASELKTTKKSILNKEILIGGVSYKVIGILKEEGSTGRHDIAPGEDNDFRISDYSQFADLRRQATGIFTALIAGIAGISLIVGGIGVMNIMLVSVTERTREIGLRKALGATHQAIMLQFIIEAILLCVIGGLIGVIIGTTLLYLLANLNDWPFALPIGAIFGSITFSAMVGLFFGIWPARRAAKLDPAISLRYE